MKRQRNTKTHKKAPPETRRDREIVDEERTTQRNEETYTHKEAHKEALKQTNREAHKEIHK